MASGGLPPNGFETISNPLPDTALRLVRLHLNSFRPVASVGQPQIDVVGEFLGIQIKKRESLSPDQLPRRRAAFPSSLRAISTVSKLRDRGKYRAISHRPIIKSLGCEKITSTR
jgi:hypothetical protein